MTSTSESGTSVHLLSRHRATIALLWTGLALAALVITPLMLRTTTPIFQMFWLIVPLIVPLISLVRHRDTGLDSEFLTVGKDFKQQLLRVSRMQSCSSSLNRGAVSMTVCLPSR